MRLNIYIIEETMSLFFILKSPVGTIRGNSIGIETWEIVIMASR